MIGETINAPYAEKFTVSNVFSSDMVVQRGEHIRVWGFADASENGHKVSGEFMGMFAEARIENGAWTLTFGARLNASISSGVSDSALIRNRGTLPIDGGGRLSISGAAATKA